jgi:hypothetical protein
MRLSRKLWDARVPRRRKGVKTRPSAKIRASGLSLIPAVRWLPPRTGPLGRLLVGSPDVIDYAILWPPRKRPKASAARRRRHDSWHGRIRRSSKVPGGCATSWFATVTRPTRFTLSSEDGYPLRLRLTRAFNHIPIIFLVLRNNFIRTKSLRRIPSPRLTHPVM